MSINYSINFKYNTLWKQLKRERNYLKKHVKDF